MSLDTYTNAVWLGEETLGGNPVLGWLRHIAEPIK
jgi:hypothetical protein